ncbi:LEPR protein, partial [Sitta europaea]|nr:LEPR protein [Sitta europaea]
MCWQIIPTMFVLRAFLQVAAAHCMVHPVPARNFTLPCVLLNETFGRELGAPKIELSMEEENFLCCLWSASSTGCSLHRASMQARKFIPSEINLSAPQQIDCSWNMKCWIRGQLDLLLCNLQLLKVDLRAELQVNLFYSETQGSVPGTAPAQGGTSLFPAPGSAPPQAGPFPFPSRFPSPFPFPFPWAALSSPLLALRPADIVQPAAPGELRLELAERGELRLRWASPGPLPFPLQHQVRISAPAGPSQVRLPRARLNPPCLALAHCFFLTKPGLALRFSLTKPGLALRFSLVNLGLALHFSLTKPGLALRFSLVNLGLALHFSLTKLGLALRFSLVNLGLALRCSLTKPGLALRCSLTKPGLALRCSLTKPAFPYRALYCCPRAGHCPRRYAQLYVVDMDISISCETDGYLTKMTCRWSANPSTLLMGTLQLRYYRNPIYCSDFPKASPSSEVKECNLQGNHSYECTFQPIFLFSGYTLWIEFKHFLGTLESSPTCVIPADVVKPLPPSSVAAELSGTAGLLNVSWSQPLFAPRELAFQIRWHSGSRGDIPWQLQEVPEPGGSWAVISVQQLCVQYVVQVRCRQLQGAALWSDWSRAAQTLLQDIRAPLRGPEFWRIVSEDAARKQRNVTLLWKPLLKNHSLCSVSRYIIKHQSPGNSSWEEFVDHGTSWTFPWIEPTHTVTILAMNSIGISAVNSNLTLSQQMSTVEAVQSLSAYLVNSTCVVLVWSLCPQTPGIKSFVIEWKNLNRGEQMNWLPVPPDLRKYFIYDHFILVEQYQFSLYPVFAGGVGKARATDHFAKGGAGSGGGGSLHVVLPAVLCSSVLLLGALLLSHQRMKKLLWQEVPNPKNCSWAQGLNFQQPETLEHLFTKPPQPTPCEPPEMVLADISITKALEKEEPGDFLGLGPTFSSGCGSACSSSQDGAELRYATVSSAPRASGLCPRKRSPRRRWESSLPGGEPRGSGGARQVGTGLPQPARALSPGSSQPAGGGFPSRGYLGIASLEKPRREFWLAQSCRGMWQLQSREQGAPQHGPAKGQGFVQSSLKAKGSVPYVPQFHMATA